MEYITYYLKKPLTQNSTYYLPSNKFNNFEPFKSKEYVFNPNTEYIVGTNGPYSVPDENQRITHSNKETARKKNYISEFTNKFHQLNESNAG